MRKFWSSVFTNRSSLKPYDFVPLDFLGDKIDHHINQILDYFLDFIINLETKVKS